METAPLVVVLANVGLAAGDDLLMWLTLEGAEPALKGDDVRELVAQLGDAFRGAGLHYWIFPAIEAGPIP